MQTMYQAHPLAELLPAMSEDQYLALKSDIQTQGQYESIKLLDGIILDEAKPISCMH